MSFRRAALPLLLAAACGAQEAPLPASLGLTGEEVRGAILVDGGCGDGGLRVGLWGPRWGTEGLVSAQAEREGETLWISFPLQTGLGEGIATLRLLRGDVALLLGAREGEHELRLSQDIVPPSSELDARAEASRVRLDEERRAWEQGSFLLLDGEQTVGDLQLLGERARVAVYDAFWMTPDPVLTTARAEGPEIVFEFPVEPALQGEQAQLRVNVPTATAVVPAGVEPTELDRRLSLRPGELEPAAREALQAEATLLADAIESEQTGALAMRLAAEARTEDGRCLGPEALDPEWRLLLHGYQISVVQSEDELHCIVEVSPVLPQHGRHLRARYSSKTLP